MKVLKQEYGRYVNGKNVFVYVYIQMKTYK